MCRAVWAPHAADGVVNTSQDFISCCDYIPVKLIGSSSPLKPCHVARFHSATQIINSVARNTKIKRGYSRLPWWYDRNTRAWLWYQTQICGRLRPFAFKYANGSVQSLFRRLLMLLYWNTNPLSVNVPGITKWERHCIVEGCPLYLSKCGGSECGA